MATTVKTISLNISDIPRHFNMEYNAELCARDVIAYIRGTIEPDPWVPVVIRCKGKPVAINELEEAAIYWEGVNESRIDTTRSLGVQAYQVVRVSDLDVSLEDCGLDAIVSNYRSAHNLSDCDVLIDGNDDGDGPNSQIFTKLRAYVSSTEREDIIFPSFIVRQNKLMEGGLDISVYASDIELKRSRNSLDAAYLQKTLDELNSKIDPSRTVIQDLKEYRSRDVKLLSTYLTLKYHLPPIYVASFISEYKRFQFFYPFDQLSLYERMVFILRLPMAVGYLSIHNSFQCLAKVAIRKYPKPHYVFRLGRVPELMPDPTEFEIQVGDPRYKLFDYRSQFKGSLHPFPASGNTDKTAMAIGGTDDAMTDKKLVDLFSGLASMVHDEEIYPTIKNTVIVERNQERFLLYCPEEGAVQLQLTSELFGQALELLPESRFGQMIDAQIAFALLQKARATNAAQGTKALVARWKQFDPKLALFPAVSLEISLFSKLLPVHQNGLSYYDTRLRCYQNVLPIVTSLDSPARDISPLFDSIPLSTLRKDSQGGYAVNSFGTLANYSAHNPELPITFRSFRGWRLL